MAARLRRPFVCAANILALVFCLIGWTFVDPTPARSESLSLVWRSRSISSNTLATDFGTLYGALNRLYLLGVRFPTKQVAMRGRSIEQMLVQEHQYAGPFVSTEADRLLCRLNEQICSISASGTETKWKGSDNSQITIPAFDFKSFWTPEYYTAKSGDKIDAIVVRDRQGCESLDEDCKQLLKSLNPDKQDKEILERPVGRIVVPTLNYFTELRFEEIALLLDSGQATSSLKDLDILRNSPDPSRKRRADAIFTALDPVLTNIVAISGAKPQSAGLTTALQTSAVAPPPYQSALARRQELFRLIGVVNWNQAENGPPTRVKVALIDSRIDDEHCDFDQGQVRTPISPRVLTRGLMPVQRGDCDAVVIQRPSVAVHGTHVAGIIAARVGSLIGQGIYPFSDLYSYELDLGDSQAFLQSMAALTERLAKDSITILNISGQYENTLSKSVDPFEEWILLKGAFSHHILVVAAAGNDGRKIAANQECPIRPACLSTIHRNVISVIAVDDDPKSPAPAVFQPNGNLRPSSNFGERFDIAAPGIRVPSTAPFNQIAEMEGTSQATPMVSGAAALLFATRWASPGEIKNRLIWTSDLLPSLRNKVLGGRLNIAAAVSSPDLDVIQLSDGKILRGTIAERSRYTVHFATPETEKIPLSRLRRLVKNADGSWDIMYLSKDDKDAPLTRRHGALKWLKYRDDDGIVNADSLSIADLAGDEQDFKLSQLTDFSSGMK